MIEPGLSCIVFIPIYRLPLPETERLALARCLKLLPLSACICYPISLAAQVKSFFDSEAFSCFRDLFFRPYPDLCFESVSSYNRLLLSPEFYEDFRSWDFVLVFQLDAWIIGGDISPWLKSNYSYIGAPWPPLTGPDTGSSNYTVGNGGLSLRRVSHVLRLLNSWRFRFHRVYAPAEMARQLFHGPCHPGASTFSSVLSVLRRSALLALSVIGFRNNLAYFVEMGLHEDHIYGLLASRVAPWFKVAPAPNAAAFSIECCPEEVLAHFQIDLPFGCHAWEKYESDFYLRRFSESFSDVLNMLK